MNHNHIAIVPAGNNHFWHIKFAICNKSSFYYIETLIKGFKQVKRQVN